MSLISEERKTVLTITLMIVFVFIATSVIFAYTQQLMSEKELVGGFKSASMYSTNYISADNANEMKGVLDSTTNKVLLNRELNRTSINEIVNSIAIRNPARRNDVINLLSSWLSLLTTIGNRNLSIDESGRRFNRNLSSTSTETTLKCKFSIIEAVLAIYYATGAMATTKTSGLENVLGSGSFNVAFAVQFDKKFQNQVGNQNQPFINQIIPGESYVLKASQVDDYIIRRQMTNKAKGIGTPEDEKARVHSATNRQSKTWFASTEFQTKVNQGDIRNVEKYLSTLYLNGAYLTTDECKKQFIDYTKIDYDTPLRGFWSVEEFLKPVNFQMLKPRAKNPEDTAFYYRYLLPYFQFMLDFNDSLWGRAPSNFSYFDWKIGNLGFKQAQPGAIAQYKIIDAELNSAFTAYNTGAVGNKLINISMTHYLDYSNETKQYYESRHPGEPKLPDRIVFYGQFHPREASLQICFRDFMSILYNTNRKAYGDNLKTVGRPGPGGISWGRTVNNRYMRGMIRGIDDITKWVYGILHDEVNVVKAKNLTNMRSKSADDKAVLPPAIKFSLEEALEYIKVDEYVEVTPHFMRIRKIILDELERKRANR